MTKCYPLTPRQLQLLAWVTLYRNAHHGISPTHEAMAKYMGVTHISKLVAALVRRGALMSLPGSYRAMKENAEHPQAMTPEEALAYLKSSTAAGVGPGNVGERKVKRAYQKQREDLLALARRKRYALRAWGLVRKQMERSEPYYALDVHMEKVRNEMRALQKMLYPPRKRQRSVAGS